MTSTQWDMFVWGGIGLLILVCELAAAFGAHAGVRVPWTTLSTFSWRIEDASDLAKIVFVAGWAVFGVYIAARWP